MSNSNIIPGLVSITHSAVGEDLSSPIQGLPSTTRVVVYIPLEIYQLLAAALGGPPNIMNALLSSFVEVHINNSATGVHYRGGISDIQPIQNHVPDAIMNLSPRGATTASQFHENIHPPYHGPSGMPWEHATAILGTGSSGLESVPRDLNSHAALRVHYPLLPPELPSTIQPTFLPSVSSSSNIVAPLGDQPDLLGVGAHGHQIQQPGGPRAYMVDGLWVDEEYLMDGHGRYINVHACGREHSPCSLWVKADRRSIMRHGQRWHRDARGSDGDRKITCPWSGCDSQMRASAVPRHTLSAHFGAMWTCTGCSKSFTRHDSFTAHSRKCDNLGATVKYDASTRVIDTTNVLRHYN